VTEPYTAKDICRVLRYVIKERSQSSIPTTEGEIIEISHRSVIPDNSYGIPEFHQNSRNSTIIPRIPKKPKESQRITKFDRSVIPTIISPSPTTEALTKQPYLFFSDFFSNPRSSHIHFSVVIHETAIFIFQCSDA
jgi:hypothetical protein